MRFWCISAALLVMGLLTTLGNAQEIIEGTAVVPGRSPVDPVFARTESVGPGRRKRPTATVPAEPSESLPEDAQALLSVFDNEAAELRKKVEQEIQERRQTLIVGLQALQDGYTRNAKLDEAVAIRNTIRQLNVSHLNVQPNPGNLTAFQDRIGDVFYFDVVGRPVAMIWGSEVYTCDSDLGTAAVHAGVLKSGQRGIVKVTIVNSPETHHGSVQYGVTSANWGSFSASYAVESAIGNSMPAAVSKPDSPLPRHK